MTSDQRRIAITREVDILEARHWGRLMASELGFGPSDQAVITTAISEVARNILEYATKGEIILCNESGGRQAGLVVIARDQGPGIADVDQAMQDGFSTGRGLGLGLPGARRLMDEFEIESELGKGTVITMRKWAPDAL